MAACSPKTSLVINEFNTLQYCTYTQYMYINNWETMFFNPLFLTKCSNSVSW